VETAFFKHVFARYSNQSVGFSYWRGKREREVDIVAEIEGRLLPFEVKYRSQNTGAGDVKGLAEFCQTRKVPRGYVITREMQDFSIMPLGFEVETRTGEAPARIAKIPAPLACYWLGKTELDSLAEE
jgi:predicted AAA+ superfamily ATPase